MILRQEEKVQFALRELYEKYGFCRFKMNKFEEYDLYAKVKDSLISDGIITFTDMGGKLMALKPDVTLSIIKNSRESLQRVYYNENVYRVSKNTHCFKEILQAGIECIGQVDDYCIFEVILLAIKSLKAICDNVILDISHLGIIKQIISALPQDTQKEILRCVCEKNVHELPKTFVTDTIIKLTELSGTPSEVLPKLYDMLGENECAKQLEKICSALENAGFGDCINIDFSVSGDISYYNGLVFKGFVEGVPECVLSGGQYDGLMQKMGKNEKAIGFAVYLDSLERLESESKKYDADTVIIYSDNTELDSLYSKIQQLQSEGKSVSAFKTLPTGYRYKNKIELGGGKNA